MIVFDIETLPTQDEELINRLCADLRPPANYKNDDAIEKWVAEAKNKAVADTSLNGAYGRIACISWIDTEIDINPQSTSAYMDEAEVLLDFYANLIDDDIVFCGHNIAAFDLQFIKHRSIINGIQPPKGLFAAMNTKPWDDCIKDTMLMWSKTKMISLDTLAWILDIKNENTFGGDQVAEMWEKNPNAVIQKCMTDVSVTWKVYQRLTFGVDVF